MDDHHQTWCKQIRSPRARHDGYALGWSMENLVIFTWGCHGRWNGRHSTSTNELVWERTSYCCQGRNCVPGTSELIGEDLGIIISLVAMLSNGID